MTAKLPALSIALSALASVCAGHESLSADGRAVLVSLNRFHDADYPTAEQRMLHDLSQALSDLRRPRLTYWMTNPDTSEVVGVSIFERGVAAEVLAQLEPLRRAPEIELHYEVEIVGDFSRQP